MPGWSRPHVSASLAPQLRVWVSDLSRAEDVLSYYCCAGAFPSVTKQKECSVSSASIRRSQYLWSQSEGLLLRSIDGMSCIDVLDIKPSWGEQTCEASGEGMLGEFPWLPAQ